MKYLLTLLCIFALRAQALEPMTDTDLEQVSGQEGMQLTLRLRNNVDELLNPVGCSGPLNPCRMGLEFAGRDGIWLMLKDYYGYISFNSIRLDGSELPASYTSYEDADRFLGLDGSCLVAGCDPRSLKAVKVTYPFSKAVGEYDDMLLLMNIGRTALEFDDGPTPGYLRDAASGSVLGFRMSDSTSLNAPAKARFDGSAYVFGF
ncbi:MAG: hypothetical protein P1U64_06435 [Alcanivoracaceae bacterium]|nr:hypothetical protein [Alcanivoracaceae bacterium]